VEREGTKSLRLATTLDRASVALLGGDLGLKGLAIASPKGFPAPHMLEAADIDVRVRFADLRREPIHVQSLTIDRPTLVIEQSGGALNFRKAMELLPQSDPNKPPMKLVIDELAVRDAQVIVRPGLPGVRQEITARVPSLTMKDIGRGKGANNGAAIRDVVLQVIGALAEKAAQSGELPVQVEALLHLNAAQLAGKLGADAMKQVVRDPAAVAKDPLKTLEGLAPAGRSKPSRR
jgi:uncharacterized protein involved in outer membrane biogenesis